MGRYCRQMQCLWRFVITHTVDKKQGALLINPRYKLTFRGNIKRTCDRNHRKLKQDLILFSKWTENEEVIELVNSAGCCLNLQTLEYLQTQEMYSQFMKLTESDNPSVKKRIILSSLHKDVMREFSNTFIYKAHPSRLSFFLFVYQELCGVAVHCGSWKHTPCFPLLPRQHILPDADNCCFCCLFCFFHCLNMNHLGCSSKYRRFLLSACSDNLFLIWCTLLVIKWRFVWSRFISENEDMLTISRRKPMRGNMSNVESVSAESNT